MFCSTQAVKAKMRHTHLLSHLLTPPKDINLEDQNVFGLGCNYEIYGGGREKGKKKGGNMGKKQFLQAFLSDIVSTERQHMNYTVPKHSDGFLPALWKRLELLTA